MTRRYNYLVLAIQVPWKNMAKTPNSALHELKLFVRVLLLLLFWEETPPGGASPSLKNFIP